MQGSQAPPRLGKIKRLTTLVPTSNIAAITFLHSNFPRASCMFKQIFNVFLLILLPDPEESKALKNF
jgi:hypothetical protein